MFRIRTVMILATLIFPTALARGADSFTAGQKVEVREGDSWSPATVTGHEGRKFHIHYDGGDDSTDEWVTLDRIRKTQSPTAGPGGAGSVVPVHPAPKAAATAAFAVGDKIECKWGGLWRKAAVVRKSGDWTLVLYDNVWYEWVQPWRLRTVGSTQDTEEDSQPRGFVKKGTPAPTEAPEDASPGAHTSTDRTSKAPDEDAFHISTESGPGGVAILKADLSGQDVEPIAVQATANPDPDPITPAPRMLSLNHGAPAMGVKTELVTHPQGKYALLTFVPFSKDDNVSIQKIELGRADVDRVAPLVPHVLPLAISPDGNRLITRSDKFFPATKWRLDLWSIDGATPKPLLSFRPYDSDANGTDEILWASYLDGTHVMTCSGSHALTLWQLTDSSVKEIYTLQGDNTVHPQMSVGGKYVVVGFGGQMKVCDAMTGKCVARLASLTDADGMVSSLSSDLKRVALSGQGRLVVCDLENDKVTMDVGLPQGVIGNHVAWLTPALLLLDQRWVFDVDHKAMVWEYTVNGATPLAQFFKDRVWFLAESGTSYAGGSGHSLLTSMAIPDDKVLAADKHISDGTFAVQPGTQISLEINVNCPDEVRTKIVDRLTKRLTDAGLTVAEGQPIKLVAESKSTDSRQVKYHGNMGSGDETVTVSDTEKSLSFVINSKTVWTTSSVTRGSAPMMVWHKKDKSIADTLAEQNKPQFQWFLTTSLPKTILNPVDAPGSSPFGAIAGRSRNVR